jgi:predicted ATP-grasp superfamily ATP-dependent carboligase
MSDIKNDTTKTAANTKTITCNLHNPTTARRVIYDGIEGSRKSITVDAGETVHNVTISRRIAEEMRDRNRAKKDSDLQIKPLTVPTEPEDEKTAA